MTCATQSFEAFVLEWTGRDMAYHAQYETTGLTFAKACWERAFTAGAEATREATALSCEGIADKYQRTEGMNYPELKSDAQTGASDCEWAIRALPIPKP